jgi:DNA polymerase-3 subunit epsilon
MCDLFHIELKEHHNALEDARAAQKIFKYLNEGYDIGEYTEFYYESKFNEKIDSKLETNINSLYGILQGINYDGIIDNEEINKIKLWTEENRIYKQYLLFNRVITELEKILEDNIITEYERIELITVVSSINKSKIYSEATLALQILNGVLDGIICDSKINKKEIENLKTWLKVNDYLKDVYPYDKVLLEVNKVLEDEILTEEESKYLLNIFSSIINPKSNVEENIDFKDKTFCLTGEFINGSKQEISKRIQELGGVEKSGVSAKLNYLIVGEVGSEAWKFGNVGGKQTKAQELNEKGANIIVVLEEELKI